MSSLRNAAPRRPHRERAQPQNRTKWGILEKHKDYSLRAADYNVKKRKLSHLREKARDRNPDEFAFGMLSSRQDKKTGTRDGERAKALSVDAVKLLKTQDRGYLGLVGTRVRKERERVEEEVAGVEGWNGGKKVVFVEGREEQRGVRERLRKRHGGEADDKEPDEVEQQPPGHKSKSTKEIEAAKAKLRAERAAKKRRLRIREARLVKLQALKKREKDVTGAERELEWQRAKMAHTVGGVNKNGVKWRIRERKR